MLGGATAQGHTVEGGMKLGILEALGLASCRVLGSLPSTQLVKGTGPLLPTEWKLPVHLRKDKVLILRWGKGLASNAS